MSPAAALDRALSVLLAPGIGNTMGDWAMSQARQT